MALNKTPKHGSVEVITSDNGHIHKRGNILTYITGPLFIYIYIYSYIYIYIKHIHTYKSYAYGSPRSPFENADMENEME